MLSIEKSTSSAKTFDALPAFGCNLVDLDLNSIKKDYLPFAISADILEQNHRDFEQQIASLRMYDIVHKVPTNAGILVFGLTPQFYLSGAYIQYVKFDGIDMTPNPKEKIFKGSLITELKIISDFIRYNIIEERPVRNETMQEKQLFNYPFWALRELLLNAVIHRNYESNAPIYIYHYTDRIEIINPGGLYGEVRPDNFPNANDYRNPVIAESMKILGYVNRFNYGIRQAQKELANNNNPPAVFRLDLVTKFMVTIQVSSLWN